jgi:hypothetical protein
MKCFLYKRQLSKDSELPLEITLKTDDFTLLHAPNKAHSLFFDFDICIS